MMGPRRIDNLVLCTGPPDSALGRYAATRLTRELPDTRVHVVYQRGAQGTNAPARDDPPHHPALKRWYWSVAHRWERWGTGRWRWRYDHWARHTDDLLRRAAADGAVGADCHCVVSVNDHVERIRDIAPDVLLVFGGRRVDPTVLDAAGVALNIHCGKLPEYRGVKSALFALSNNEPQHVGVTLHVAEAAIDAGPIVRWQPVPPHRAGSIPALIFMLYQTGLDLAVEAIHHLPRAGIDTQPQAGTPHVYRMRDLNARIIRSAHQNLHRLRRCQPRGDREGVVVCERRWAAS